MIFELFCNEFKSCDWLNQLIWFVICIMKQFYLDKGWIDYIYLIGDKGDWYLYVNVYILECYKYVDGMFMGEKWFELFDCIV